MKKLISMIVVCAVVALAFVTTFAGCTGTHENAEKSAVCFVLVNTANSQGLNLTNPLIQDTVFNTIRNYGYISIVNGDGDPKVVFMQSFEIEDRFKNAAAVKLDRDARNKTDALIDSMEMVTAIDPEVDYMAALNLAARSLSSLEGYDNKSIIVIGTGLSTSGVLNFQNNLLSTEPATVVKLLEEKKEIPDFSGISVYWAQLGDVALPQEPLNSIQKDKLQQIYKGIIETGGGTFTYNTFIANPVNEDISYPPVSIIELPDDDPIIFDSEIIESIDSNNPVILTEEDICFKGDSAEFKDPDKAYKVLRLIADKYSGISILVCGTTAGDSPTEHTKTLSKQRAEAVMNCLINDFGLDPSKIIAIGLGNQDPWHVHGIPVQDKEASCNRKVVILDASSEIALEIISNFDY